MENFENFVNTVLKDNSVTRCDNAEPLAHLLDGHTTFLMCNKNNRESIHEYRKKWIVENYLYINNIQHSNIDSYSIFYDTYLKDTDKFSGTFQPPSTMCDNYMNDVHHDDVEFHYKELANRYNRYIEDQERKYTEIQENVYMESDTSSSAPSEEMYSDYDYNDCDYGYEYYEEEYDDDYYDDYNDW